MTLDRDEQDALSLPPKYCIFGDIKIEEIPLEKECSFAKARYDRMDRVYDEMGNEVIIDDEVKETMEGKIKENM